MQRGSRIYLVDTLIHTTIPLEPLNLNKRKYIVQYSLPRPSLSPLSDFHGLKQRAANICTESSLPPGGGASTSHEGIVERSQRDEGDEGWVVAGGGPPPRDACSLRGTTEIPECVCRFT